VSPFGGNPSLQADENVPGKLTSYDARVFILGLAERLGVNPAHVLPGYEDTWYYLWKERRLPVNVDPFENHLAMRKTGAPGARFRTGFGRGRRIRPAVESANPIPMGKANGRAALGISAPSGCI